MITLIYGAKGSGKTKRIIDAANALQTGGHCTFFGKPRYALELNREIRFINPEDYQLVGKEKLIGFVLGLIAGDADIGDMFIDGLHRVVGCDVTELSDVFDALDRIGMTYNVNFTVSVTTGAQLPEYLKKYI